MKKAVLLFVLLLMPFIHIYAYENDYFSIYISDKYNEKHINDKSYMWTNNNDYISVTISDNTNKYNIKNIHTEDLIKQKEYLQESYSNKISSKVEISDLQIHKDKKTYYIEYNITINSKDSIGHDMYQRVRMYTSDNYIYVVTFNSDNEIDDFNYTNLINTFKIKDDYLENLKGKPYFILLFTSLALLILVYIYIDKKKHI